MNEALIDRIVAILNSIIEEIEISKDQLDDDLVERNMDSIKFITLIVTLEEEYKCEIPDEKLLISEMNTIRKIANVLNSLLESSHED